MRSACSQEIVEPRALQQQLIDDLAQTVQIHHKMLLKAKESGDKNWIRGFSWVLAPMVVLHEKTGEAKYLEWAKTNLMEMIETAIDENGKVTPILSSLRSMQPFCETYIYLNKKGMI